MRNIFLFVILFFILSNNIYSENYILKIKKAHSYKEFIKYYKKVNNKKTFAQGKIIVNSIHRFNDLHPKIINKNFIKNFARLSDPLLEEQTWLTLIDGYNLINLSTGKGIVVGILDSGVEKEHEDLKGQIIKYYNVAENNNNVADSYGHGTAVAGIIAAIANNGNGIRGIAPECKLIVAKINVGASPSFDDYSVAAGIYYLVDQGSQIINMSIQMNNVNEAVEDAIAYAKEKGVILVASSGNYGSNEESYPASNSYVLGVGSVNNEYEISSFSNYDNNIFIFAPGENILSTYISNNYSYESGTSFSAPMISGIIADLLSINPYLSYDNIKTVILGNVSHKTADNNYSVIDLDDSVYGTGVKIYPNKDIYHKNDVLTMYIKMPPINTNFDFYFGCIHNGILYMLNYENGQYMWKNNYHYTAANLNPLSDYLTINIFGGDSSVFSSVQLSENLLNETYQFCAAYSKNGVLIGYINCKTISIN